LWNVSLHPHDALARKIDFEVAAGMRSLEKEDVQLGSPNRTSWRRAVRRVDQSGAFVQVARGPLVGGIDDAGAIDRR
jgi:hypothetical protein